MKFLASAHTDVGISKQVNQDAFCLKTARTPYLNIAFAVLCDGMGGLKNGELASAFVINTFSEWFDLELPRMMESGTNMTAIRNRWEELIQEKNRRIMQFGQERNISLGTTLTAVLLVGSEYLLAQVGDSRLYQIGTGITQISRDQTVVAREVELGRLTPEQARVDKRKNVLLQCVGASKVLQPAYVTGNLPVGQALLLCSDGFRHELREEEMLGVLSPPLLDSERTIKRYLMELVETNKSRGERDNITAMLIKAIP